MHRGLEEAEFGGVGGLKFGLDAEGQGDVVVRDVAAAEAEGYGAVEVFEDSQDDFFEEIGRGAR